MKVHFILLLILFGLVGTGCWDTSMLKDKSLIQGAGLDITEEGKIVSTLIIPTDNKNMGEELIKSSVGNTPRETRVSMDRKVQERLDASKNKIVVLSEALAREGIFPFLDIYYRDPRSALIARVAVSKMAPIDLFSIKLPGQQPMSKYITDLIESAENLSFTPQYNLQLICPMMFDPGEDFVVPLLDGGKDEIVVTGLALFDGMFMKGELNPTEGLMYTLLSNQMKREATITQKINNNNSPSPANYVTLIVRKMKRNLEITFDEQDNPYVNIHLILKVAVFEYPQDNLHKPEENIKLNNILSDKLTHLSEQVIGKMQEANCDGFGIGRRLMAFHPDKWKQYNWEEDYSNITIEPKVTVEIIRHGIIN